MRNALSVLLMVVLQSTSQGAPSANPVISEVKSIEKDSAGTVSGISLNLTNNSGKSVTAFAVKVVLLAVDGKPLTKTSVVKALSQMGDGKPYPPGAVWSLDIQLVPVRAPDVRVSIDYVTFDDGTSWGPDTEKRSLVISGLMMGASSERERLARKLKTEGVEALIEELGRKNP